MRPNLLSTSNVAYDFNLTSSHEKKYVLVIIIVTVNKSVPFRKT